MGTVDFDTQQAATLEIAKAFVRSVAGLPCSCWAAWALYVCDELDRHATDLHTARKLAHELAEARSLLDIRMRRGLW